MKQAGFQELPALVYGRLLIEESEKLPVIRSTLNETETNILEAVRVLMHAKVVAVDVVKDSYVMYALNPEVVWEAYKTELIWSFACTPYDFSRARCYSQDLPSQNTDALQYACEIIDQIRHAALLLYQSQPSVRKHRWREAFDGEHLAVLLAEAISEAKLSIRAVSKPPRSSQVALIWESIRSRMLEGVAYQRISNLDEVIEHGLHIVERDMYRHGVDLRVIDSSIVEHKFYTVDSKLVLVYHLTGDEGSELVGRVTTEKNIIKRYRKRFGHYYKESIPASVVVEFLRERAEVLSDNARALGFKEPEISWLECLVNWGTFCELRHPGIEDQSNLERRAFESGLIIYGTTGRPIPDYRVTLDDIAANVSLISEESHESRGN